MENNSELHKERQIFKNYRGILGILANIKMVIQKYVIWGGGLMSPKFLIIDGSSLVYRAFYALPLLTAANGQYTNAVYGFAMMLVKLLDEIKPDAAAVAFDKGRITFRNEQYSQYKAQRKATPIELSEQFPLVKELLTGFGITTLEEAGYEADDIIGTLATKGAEAGFEVIIVTGDRDALQLIGPRTRVMLTKKGISDLAIFDAKAFEAKYGVKTTQLIDLKGLMGDSSDNIPGVPGVGEKTAVKLLTEFGTVEQLVTNIDKVSGKKLQERLRDNAELAILSKQLATIVCDMPLRFSPELFTLQPDVDKIRKLFSKFEFKSLLTRMDVIFPESVLPKTEMKENLPKAVWLANDTELEELCQYIHIQSFMVIFPLITGQVPRVQMKGLAIVGRADTTVYISPKSPGWGKVMALMADGSVQKVTHDAKILYNACAFEGIILSGVIFDTMLAAYLLDPTAAGYPLVSLQEQYIGKHSNLQREEEIPAPDYAAWSCSVVHVLYPVLKQRLQENGLESLFYEIELPLIEVLAAMEGCGIKVDKGYLQEMSVTIAAQIEQLFSEIQLLAGETFNVNSTKQLGNVLFEKLSLPVIKKTKTGYSTDAEVLEKLIGIHPIVDKLLEYRVLTKLKSTYLDGLQQLISSSSGRVHTNFNQMVTATGRLSSSEPNLQNIPIRTEIGRKIRELFVPGEGYEYIMSADYSQIELRIMAHISSDANLIEAFIQEKDIHARTAAEVFGVDMDQVTAEMRSRAKAVNFGIVYGISDYGLSRNIGVTRKEAGKYIDKYFTRYPGVKEFMNRVVTEAHQLGYVTTLFGRRRYLPDIRSSNFNQRSFAERTAMNTPIQGTAADVIKKAMIEVYRALSQKNLRSRILLQVHDELVLEVAQEEVDQVAAIVKEAMEQAVQLAVPLTVDVKWGKSWAEAK